MKNILVISLISASILIGTSFFSYAVAEEEARTAGVVKKESSYSDTYRQLSLFGDVFERVRAQYVEEVSDKELIEHALSGMLSNLDPHSSYLNEESFKEMRVETKGEFGGLGIEVTMDNGLVKVVSPIDDTPAYRAGIKAGDYISKINDEPVMGMDLKDAVKKMRGKVGSTIDLYILREGEDAPLEITITRDIIKIKSVKSRVEGNVGYIRITTFSQNTGSGVKKAIKDIKEKLGDSITGYVLDLRNNPGGLLSQAISVADTFLDKGEIVSQRGRYEEDTERTNATKGDLSDGLPIVVLINGGSASASEIVAGALQDHKRAIIMGTQSFGKGSVQTVIPLPGNGAMRLTTARYYTPSGKSIQATGITPDIEVEQAKLETYANKYQRLRESDLPGALKNENGKKDISKKKKPKAAVNDNKKDKNNDSKEGNDPVDYQLERALDLINGLSLYNEQKHSVAK